MENLQVCNKTAVVGGSQHRLSPLSVQPKYLMLCQILAGPPHLAEYDAEAEDARHQAIKQELLTKLDAQLVSSSLAACATDTTSTEERSQSCSYAFITDRCGSG